MRNLSFALTTAQIRARTKTVTRRKGTWWSTVLKPGDLVCAVEKSQGIRKGALVRLGTIRVVRLDVQNLLDGLTDQDVALEGFPDKSVTEFLFMFCEHMAVGPSALVTRIEFEHVEEQP